MYFCMKIANFYSRLFYKFKQKRINRKSFQKKFSRELPHSKRVSEIFMFYLKKWQFLKIYVKNDNLKKLYKKWYFLKFFKVKNRIQIYTKAHQIAPFIKIFSGGMPPNPPSKAHGFAMRSMSLRDMQISKSQKKNSWPPPPKSWGRPW